uniref:Gfo/Idh/MocA-like oxidoreductase N-terminal domain-containing protein n=1 Tax=Percolomonas cosmopolitus TaxID=63605 RepID=A0A7S1KU32_9EUKA|eukprot:CAMPEP_0117445054 /NCGR_PEP_ID=MMETSP0759-20121206/5581_1 /TAXON_ID=63605 /ORGANISM="Percolomonas cosmopolitus, Strain WS" /LENGTH=388 /DNA_ID=CAMNT_0005237185 /DNA_START=9 /DNA_END=1175 /DNA_ORIENTATION=-
MSPSLPPLQATIIGFGMAGRGLHGNLISLSSKIMLRSLLIPSYANKTQHYESELASFCQKMQIPREAIAIYQSYAELLEDRDAIDLIVVATPNDSHLSYAKRAFQDGFNVVVDKPVANNLEEWHELSQLIKQRERETSGLKRLPLLSVFHNRRLDGDFLTVCQILEQQRLGTLMHMELSWQKSRPTKDWKRVPVEQGGGRFFDLGVHMLDQVLELLCRRMDYSVKSVYCDMKFDEYDSEISTICHLKFERAESEVPEHEVSRAKEVSVLIDTSTLPTIEKPRFLLVGTKGTYVKYGVDPQEKCLFAGNIHSAIEPDELHGTLVTVDKQNPEKVATLNGKWLNYYDNIADAIRDESVRPIVEMKTMDPLMRIMDGAVRSARSGKVVTEM